MNRMPHTIESGPGYPCCSFTRLVVDVAVSKVATRVLSTLATLELVVATIL
jgi:hypothetical protein